MKQIPERSMNKVIVVTRKTRLTELIQKYNTFEQAKFYIEHLGADFSDYIQEDRTYREAVKKVVAQAEKYARVQEVDRTFFPNLLLGKEDIIVTVGQDGLVANVMKYLNNHPLIGVNPDIRRWDGVLLPFEPGDLAGILPAVLGKNYRQKAVTMAKASSRDGQEMLAVNDLFIGPRTHTSAQYDLRWNKKNGISVLKRHYRVYRPWRHRLAQIHYNPGKTDSRGLQRRKRHFLRDAGLGRRPPHLCGKRAVSEQIHPGRDCLWKAGKGRHLPHCFQNGGKRRSIFRRNGERRHRV